MVNELVETLKTNPFKAPVFKAVCQSEVTEPYSDRIISAASTG